MLQDKKAGQDRRDQEVDKGTPQSKKHLKQASESKLSDTSTTDDRYELSLCPGNSSHCDGGWRPLVATNRYCFRNGNTLHVSLYFLKVVKQ